MKVLILSTYKKAGGAAIAAARLLDALNRNGVEASMLCRKNLSWWKGKPQSWSSILERGVIWVANGFSKKNLWATDIALFGQDITHTKEYREADVIHLHWINQGFISLSAIERFVRDGKRVVWTMHDAWNAMGAYHLKIQQQNDFLEHKMAERKKRLYSSIQIQFVTCSQWLRDEAMSSELMSGQNITAIPNPLDTNLFKPQPHTNRRRVLFVAQDVNNKMKGIQYLNEAAAMLPDVEILALGRDIPYIKDTVKMAELYASVDAFVLPSLSENLPNTIMEAMSCGTPCVGFKVGGIPEMIDHKINGYLAKYKDSQDLAEGIKYVLDNANHDKLATAARQKIIDCYSEKAVTEMYKSVYHH